MLVDFRANTMKRDRSIRAEGAEQERVKWQSVVADKDTQIADKDALIAELLARLNEK